MSLDVPQNIPVLSSPIPGVKTEYLLTQDFVQDRASFAPKDLNSAHPYSEFSTFLLVEEGERRDIGGGLVRWTRSYAKVPDTHYDWEMTNYSFIGLTGSGGVNVPTIQGRNRSSRQVKSRLQFDYFLVPSTGVTDPILGGDPFDISDPGDIPKVWAMQYVFQAAFHGAVFGGIFYPTDVLNGASSSSPTWPTLEQYQGMMADALTNEWGAGVSKVILFNDYTISGTYPTLSGHYMGAVDTSTSVPATTVDGTHPGGGIIPIEDSRLVRWRGNIWQRITRFALAQ